MNEVDIEKNIVSYLYQLNPAILKLPRISTVRLKKIVGGDYNLNFKVIINKNQLFLFRINIEQQSGLKNQVDYEFKSLKFLVKKNIAPYPYFKDTSKQFFKHDILVEKFFKGAHLRYSSKLLKEVGKLFARLHSLNVQKNRFLIKWKSPLVDNFNFVVSELNVYRKRPSAQKSFVKLSDKILARSKPFLEKYKNLFQPLSIIHTDPVNSNFIISPKGLRLIDWEKPRIDDPSYDICVFLAEASNVWDAKRVLSKQEKKYFINSYLKFIKAENLERKIEIRQPLISLHWALWAQSRICDVKEGVIAKELGKQNFQRYKWVADIRYLKRFI